jgi:hypothetical protein
MDTEAGPSVAYIKGCEITDKIIEIKDTIVKFYDFGSKMN